MSVFRRLSFVTWLVERNSCKQRNMSGLSNLKFDNAVLRELPIDKEHGNRQRQVSGACFSLVDQTQVENPRLVSASQSALKLLGIKENEVTTDDFVQHFGGNKLLEGSQPAAHCYCGHQFGYFSGQLGDGAAMYLGEIINEKDERWELQLKGAGLTPFSRQADGRKVLRSSIREYLCSEAMFHLGIPTTRAGSCITSDSRVVRDIHYDGHPKMERCTIVSRIAPTFLRFGSFEIFKTKDSQTGRAGPCINHKDILPIMLDYVIKYFYPEISNEHEDSKQEMYLEFYREIIRRTAKLVAQWQCVGFCHGVLNTDNMSIVGVTIDYGPFGFMDFFDADHVCNSSDNNARYSYKKQPEICKWNLWKLGEAIKELFANPDHAKEVLNEMYDIEFSKQYYGIMRKKLGLLDAQEDDKELIQKLLNAMQQSASDFTNTFSILMDADWSKENEIEEVIQKILAQCLDVEGIKKRTKSDVNMSQVLMLLQIANQHPQILEQFGTTREELTRVVEQAEKDKESSKITQEEKTERDKKLWREWLDTYRARLLSEEIAVKDENEKCRFITKRKETMRTQNPRVVLRNYLAQEAIEAAENDDFSKVNDLLKILENPFEQPSTIDCQSDIKTSSSQAGNSQSNCKTDFSKYTSSSPAWGTELKVS
uniref:Selenoprotein O n=2 Tax=Clytia hemisphaerica TaxID=252671 RepID=A0A7M5WJL3_9CNID